MWLINAWRERRARSCLDDLRIESLRFSRLLENSRGLFDLLADGEEKSRGDYIIDMHYVTSLVDQTIERASRLVFDACVLAAGTGDVLFSLLDEQKKKADAFHLASRNRETSAAVEASEGEILEPEYRLLNQVLDWFRGSTEECGGRPMVSLLQAGLDQVMAQHPDSQAHRTASPRPTQVHRQIPHRRGRLGGICRLVAGGAGIRSGVGHRMIRQMTGALREATARARRGPEVIASRE